MIKIDEEISREQYREIQRFYFYRKKHRIIWIVLGTVVAFGIAGVNIASTGRLSVGAVVFMLLPFLSIILTNMRIDKTVKGLYDRDIKTWHIEMASDYIAAKPNNLKQGMKINSRDWSSAYELRSVILVYFNKYQFLTISKTELDDESLTTVKGWLYDRLGRKFRLKNKKKQ